MSGLRDIYQNAADKGPLDIRDSDLPNYLDKVYDDIKDKLTEAGFSIFPGASYANHDTGKAHRHFIVRTSEDDNQFSRENGAFCLHVLTDHEKKLNGFLDILFRNTVERARMKNTEVVFQLDTPSSRHPKYFNYGAENKNGESQSRQHARAQSLDDIVTHIVLSLATQKLGLGEPSRKPQA